jgi:hypothetical protein
LERQEVPATPATCRRTAAPLAPLRQVSLAPRQVRLAAQLVRQQVRLEPRQAQLAAQQERRQVRLEPRQAQLAAQQERRQVRLEPRQARLELIRQRGGVARRLGIGRDGACSDGTKTRPGRHRRLVLVESLPDDKRYSSAVHPRGGMKRPF